MLRVVSAVVGFMSVLALSGSLDGAHAKEFQVLHTFSGGSDGANPRGTLIKDQQGNLYGTTAAGGASAAGTVFKIAPDGTERGRQSLWNNVLKRLLRSRKRLQTCAGRYLDHSSQISGGGDDGAYPFGGPVMDKAGNLYGTTVVGGPLNNNCTSDMGCGTVFKIAADGTETILHAFCPKTLCKDGLYPYAALVTDKDGNLYGTTDQGGKSWALGFEGYGTVFRITPKGRETVLYSFRGESDGGFPTGSLIFDRSGNLFGQAGATGGGIVFKLAPDGTETVVHSFPGASGSDNGLIFDKAGNLYGTWRFGGQGHCDGGSCGIVFKIAPDGTETDLHTFCPRNNCADGFWPIAGLVADASNLYGVATAGGAMKGSGTVFQLKK